MKALMKRSRDPGDLALVELPVPKPAPHQVVARVAYGGVCGSDLDILHSRNTIYQPPVVQGHEFSAVVHAVGSAVDHVQPGDKIVSETVFEPCGMCEECLNDDYHLCTDKAVVGWTTHGAFADYVLLNSAYVHLIGRDADLQSAALIEPLAVAAEAVHVKGGLQAGETVAVIGPGATGILSALLAQALGAKSTFLIGRGSSVPVRFPIAQALGLNHCVDSSKTDPVEYVRRHNDNHHADLVIDATGNIHGLTLAVDLIRRNGRIIELGSITTDAAFPWPKAAWQALALSFVFSSSRAAWEKAIDVFNRGDIDFKKMATSVFPLEEYEAAFATADDSRASLKVMFRPSPEENA